MNCQRFPFRLIDHIKCIDDLLTQNISKSYRLKLAGKNLFLGCWHIVGGFVFWLIIRAFIFNCNRFLYFSFPIVSLLRRDFLCLKFSQHSLFDDNPVFISSCSLEAFSISSYSMHVWMIQNNLLLEIIVGDLY